MYGGGAEGLGALFPGPVRVLSVPHRRGGGGRRQRAPAGEARATPEVMEKIVLKPVLEDRCWARRQARGCGA